MSFMICSYADESGDPQTYSVCGLLGKLSEFVELGRQWRHALREEHLTEFHAAKMENRWPPHDDIDGQRRAFLQRKFIGLIAERQIWGFNSFVEKDALARHQIALRKHMSHTEPHTFCFRMVIEQLAIEVDEYKVKNEPIAFVFDRQKEHEGKAKEIYDYLSTDEHWPLAYRLGSLTWGSRFDYVELQAADVWAYESRKNVTDTLFKQVPERWQLTLFKDAGRFNIHGYPNQQLMRLIDRLDRGDDERPAPSRQL